MRLNRAKRQWHCRSLPLQSAKTTIFYLKHNWVRRVWNAIYRRIGARREFPRAVKDIFRCKCPFSRQPRKCGSDRICFLILRADVMRWILILCFFLCKNHSTFIICNESDFPTAPKVQSERDIETWSRTMRPDSPCFCSTLPAGDKRAIGACFFSLQFETVWCQLCLKRKEGVLGCEVLNNATTFHSNCHKRRRTAPPLTTRPRIALRWFPYYQPLELVAE